MSAEIVRAAGRGLSKHASQRDPTDLAHDSFGCADDLDVYGRLVWTVWCDGPGVLEALDEQPHHPRTVAVSGIMTLK